MKEILVLLSFFIAGWLFSNLRGKILDRVKDTAKEVFDIKKFRAGLFRVTDKVSWAKDIAEMFNVRRLIIYGLIASSLFGYAYWKGQQGKPIYLDIAYGKEVQIKLNGDYLHIKKDGTVYVEDKNGNIVKQLAVKDIPALKRRLRPIAFQLVPIGVMGGGLSSDGIEFEGGGGVSFLRYWKWRLDTFLTHKGIYLGTSYKITDNSGVGIGAGKGYQGDNRVILYYNWKF